MKDELLGEERQRRKTLKRSYHNLKAKLKVLRFLMIFALFIGFCFLGFAGGFCRTSC